MPNTVFTFIFSPPARLAWLTAKIYKVPADIKQVQEFYFMILALARSSRFKCRNTAQIILEAFLENTESQSIQT